MEEKAIKLYRGFYPISFLYGVGVSLRNRLFDWGVLRTRSFELPIICIGNLAVGGTGKTPHTEYLIRLLRPTHRVAVLSRGYKRQTKGYLLATSNSPVEAIGDEPYQIQTKFPAIRVAVDEDRCHGIEQLLRLNHPNVEVILLDDALQHRYVKAGLTILLTDYHRLFCDDALLPVGRLREPATGRKRAEAIVVTKSPHSLTAADAQAIADRLKLRPHQQLFFSTFRYGKLQRLFPEGTLELPLERDLTTLQPTEELLLLTGIASPAALLRELEIYTPKIDLLAFGDHHAFSRGDMEQLRDRFEHLPGERKLIITTEKDATRLRNHPALDEALKPYIYQLPIEVEILQNQQEKFNQYIINYVTENQRNSHFPAREDAHSS